MSAKSTPEARTAVPAAALKTCSKCKVEKPRSEFSAHKQKPDGLQYNCKTCISAKMASYYKANKARINAANIANYYAARENIAEQRRQYRAANPEKHAAGYRRRKYGISSEQYVEMVARCKGRCEICKEPPDKKGLVIDHSHDTGAVRGLLCNSCNLALGHFRDDARAMRAAIDYMAKHQADGSSPSGSPHDVLEEQVIMSVPFQNEGFGE